MIFNAQFIICKCTLHVKDYIGQLLVHVRVLLSCSVGILSVHNMLMCIICTNKWWWQWTTNKSNYALLLGYQQREDVGAEHPTVDLYLYFRGGSR